MRDCARAEIEVAESIDVAELAALYRRVHARDLELPDHSVPSVEERLRWTAEAPGFAAALGYLDGRLVGAVMGCPLPAETLWWRGLGGDDPGLVKEWVGRTFAVCEAFVLPAGRKHWLGALLTQRLLDDRPEERVSLAVAESNTRVWRALLMRGFVHVGDLEPFPGWRSHRMLVHPIPVVTR